MKYIIAPPPLLLNLKKNYMEKKKFGQWDIQVQVDNSWHH